MLYRKKIENITKGIIKKYRKLKKERKQMLKPIKRPILDRNKKSYVFYKIHEDGKISFKLKTRKHDKFLKYLSNKNTFFYRNNRKMRRKLEMLTEYNKKIEKINEKIKKYEPLRRYIKNQIQSYAYKVLLKNIDEMATNSKKNILDYRIDILPFEKYITHEKLSHTITTSEVHRQDKIISKTNYTLNLRSLVLNALSCINKFEQMIRNFEKLPKNININITATFYLEGDDMPKSKMLKKEALFFDSSVEIINFKQEVIAAIFELTEIYNINYVENIELISTALIPAKEAQTAKLLWRK